MPASRRALVENGQARCDQAFQGVGTVIDHLGRVIGVHDDDGGQTAFSESETQCLGDPAGQNHRQTRVNSSLARCGMLSSLSNNWSSRVSVSISGSPPLRITSSIELSAASSLIASSHSSSLRGSSP
ncbi:MAG: hypothetical protein CM1200mP2_14080 [Planctomycetaceae bacterium]|nr:MAG: hypothetical protein CM1200mP2_14080 [Planctomycetaceae bacterium]